MRGVTRCQPTTSAGVVVPCRGCFPRAAAGPEVYIISSPHTPSEPGDEQPGQDAIRAQVGREAQAARLVELLGRSARGHEDAFAVLYDETVNRVHGVILRVLRAPDLASEVT